MINRRQLLTGASMLAAERALAQPTGNAGWRDLPWGPSQSANTGGNMGSPSFDQNFLTGSLNPASGAVFSRASTGTYYDSAGVLRTSPVNLVRNSMMAGSVPGGLPTFWGAPQLLPGGGATNTFAYGTANGVPYLDLTIAITTPMGAATPVGIAMEDALPLGGGVTLTAGVTYQLVAGALPAGITLNNVLWFQTNPGFVSQFFTPTATPQRVVTTGTSVGAQGGTLLFLSINCPAGLTYSFTLRISQPQVETGSVATTFIPTTSAASGAPRFDYDPQTLALKGLLLEDAATNLILQSGNLATSPWGLANGVVTAPVVTANQAVAPDGTLTAARIVYPAITGTNANSVVFQSITVTAVSHAFSLWMKGSVGGEQLYLFLGGASAVTSPRLTLTTQWQRFVFVTPMLAAGGTFFELGANLVNAEQTSTPAQTIFAWGAGVETNYMSSYIPTMSSQVTRAADFLSYPIVSVTGFSATKGSLAHEFISEGALPGYGGPAMMVGADPNLDYVDLCERTTAYGATPSVPALAGAGMGVAGVGAADAITLSMLLPSGPIHRGASSWAINQHLLTSTNALPTISHNVGPPTSLPVITNLSIAGYMHYQAPWSQWARHTRYWPRQLTQAELITETTLDGPTLSLDFMTPGTLDPRIVATRASTATYTDSTGIVRTAAVNAPRWDYIGGVLQGLLIEEQRSNGIWPSTNWYNIPVSPTNDGWHPNAGTSPTGANDAMGMIPCIVNTVHQFFVGFFGSVNTTYTYSVYLKSSGIKYAGVSLGNSAFATDQAVIVDLTNGTIVSQTPNGSGRIQPVGNGWYRCSITNTSDADGGNYISNVITYDDAGNFVFAGDGVKGILAFGNQIDTGTYATSYIPTTSGAVTRASDVVVMPTNPSWFNANFGTVQAEFIYKGQNPGGYGCVIALADGSVGTPSQDTFIQQYLTQTDNTIAAYSKDRGVLVSAAGVGGSVVPGAVTKSANSYQPASMNAALSGAVGGGGAVAGMLPLVTQLAFMPYGVNFQLQMTGCFRRMNYWNRALSDTEMQLRTTP